MSPTPTVTAPAVTPTTPATNVPTPDAAGAAWTVTSASPTLQTAFEIPEQRDYISALAFLSDGSAFVSGDFAGDLRVWAPDGSAISAAEVAHADNIEDVAISPAGDTVVSTATDGTVRVWTFDGAALTETGSVFDATDNVPSVAFAPDGGEFAVSSWDGFVRVYTPDGPTLVQEFETEGTPHSLAYAPDGSTLAIGGANGFIELWETAGWTRLLAVEGQGATYSNLEWSADGSTIYGASRASQIDVIDAGDGAVRESLTGDVNTVNAVALTPDQQWLASGSASGHVRLWDLASGAQVTEQRNGGFVIDVVFSPTEPLLVTGDGARLIGFAIR